MMKAEMMSKYLRFPARLIVVLILFLQSIPALCQVDSLEFWSYTLHTYSKTKADKSIGRIKFFRLKPVNDNGTQEVFFLGKRVVVQYEKYLPNISYYIYDLADSVECKRLSLHTKFFSSCLGPSVGGDLVKVGPYIFLNRDVCVECEGSQPNVDFCRPIVNKILTNVNLFKTNTLEEFVQQFVIQGKIN